MQNIQDVHEKNAVLVPIDDWEKLQKELVRLRKKVGKEKLLRDLGDSIIAVKKEIKNGVEPTGRDARDFIRALVNKT